MSGNAAVRFNFRRYRGYHRRVAAGTAAAVVVAVLAATPSVAAPTSTSIPALTAAAAAPPTVTVAGTLQSENGCAADWSATCSATDLVRGADGNYSASLLVPAGSGGFKIVLDHDWAVNYGLNGAAGGADIPVTVAAPIALTFSFDSKSHQVTLTPTATQPGLGAADQQLAGTSLRDDLTKERFYFVMTDRFANADPNNDTGSITPPAGTEARLSTGFDPTDSGFYHGGDIKGITSKLDYIKNMGTTSIWLTPSFKNQAVQGSGANVSAGYHGYWITDFTQIDPHLGSNADLKTLIDGAHAKGMKVFFDIITNHTADVIDNVQQSSEYISKAAVPYRDAAGKPFDDRTYAAGNTFPALNAQSFPYKPKFRTPADATAKVPAWLNDPLKYHNRGNAKFDGGESDMYGDFVGLDDLFTEQPAVRDGMIDIYSYWAKFGVDGFRIDTVKHVNTEFWQKFVPATRAAAASVGKDKFFEFGEVYDANPVNTSFYDTTAGLQATLDFAFQAQASSFGQGKPTSGLAELYAKDNLYTDTDSNAYSLPTFLGNHDMGRIGNFLAGGGFTGSELLRRDLLTQQLMFLTRGQPVTYYGDEQGFVGTGGDKAARQDMFPSKVASYNAQGLIGSTSTTAVSNFNTAQPIYRTIAGLSKLRDQNPALSDGAQIQRYASNDAGIFAFSRVDAKDQVEYVVALNNATTAKTVTFDTFNQDTRYQKIWGGIGSTRTDREGRITVTVPPLSSLVLKADHRMAPSKAAPSMVFTSPSTGTTVGGRTPVSVAVPQGGLNQVSFAWRTAGSTAWHKLGTDDNAPYGVFHDVSGLAKGTVVEYRAVLEDNAGHLSVAGSSAVTGTPAPTGAGSTTGVNDPPAKQPASVTIAGSLDSEMGCTGDWQPDCTAAHLGFDANSKVWSGSWNLPAGTYAYKAAIDDTWTENYGAKGVSNGGDIPLVIPAGGKKVTFYYDPSTHWVTTDLEGAILTVPGSAQSELGCSSDWSPDCLRPWLQDPDGDGIYTFSTARIPAGSYEAKVAVGLSFDTVYGAGGESPGANIGYTVPANAVVTFSYNSTTHLLTVTSKSSTQADLTRSKAQWLDRNRIAWDLPATADQYHYRLHYAAAGGLGIDASAVTGGSSVALTWAPSLPAALDAAHPNLSSYDGLKLPDYVAKDRNLLSGILRGQVVVAAYDDGGALVDATGVQLPWVLDDVYASAASTPLGINWLYGLPTLSLWAPTAQRVAVVVTPSGRPAVRVSMRNGADGVWRFIGPGSWKNATYVFEVTVYVASKDKVLTNTVTDPYSIALTTDSKRSVLVNLADPALTPAGWSTLQKPALAKSVDSSIYELHIRDFSISDATVPAAHRGTYLAFTDSNSAGMKHLKALSAAGMNTLHLLPFFDFSSVPENRAAQQNPACALAALPPASDQQYKCTAAVAETDGFNWGYDPLHYTTPEGSYSTNPNGPARTKELRQAVAGINGAGLRVVMDVVYNHTSAAGEDPNSVLDQVVPGYYQRLSADGTVENSTCCANTATEHAMMNKLVVDSVVTWAKQYKIDGFRFDLMGHQPKANILAVRGALDKLTPAHDGVDGKKIYLYGEGWNFGEVANDALFVQATQQNMAGTGVGTFNDRIRDAVRGGGPFDADPRIQGFGTGLYTDPNGNAANGTSAQQKAALLLGQDRLKVGLVGNLADYTFVDRTGATVAGRQVDYNGEPTGYTAQPSETINYVDAHDNDTLFDALSYKLPISTTMPDRVRMNTVSLASVALGQGPMFWHAGADLLRSKSFDANSYNSGDWFNRIDWTGITSTFGSGLPPETNSAKYQYMRPLLENATLKPGPADISAAAKASQDLLRLRFSSPLFRLGSAALIEQKVSFLTGGPAQIPGVVAMQIDDRVGPDSDPALARMVVVFNASATPETVRVAGASALRLSPVQAGGSDPVVKQSQVAAGSVTVPARTVAVFVQ